MSPINLAKKIHVDLPFYIKLLLVSTYHTPPQKTFCVDCGKRIRPRTIRCRACHLSLLEIIRNAKKNRKTSKQKHHFRCSFCGKFVKNNSTCNCDKTKKAKYCKCGKKIRSKIQQKCRECRNQSKPSLNEVKKLLYKHGYKKTAKILNFSRATISGWLPKDICKVCKKRKPIFKEGKCSKCFMIKNICNICGKRVSHGFTELCRKCRDKENQKKRHRCCDCGKPLISKRNKRCQKCHLKKVASKKYKCKCGAPLKHRGIKQCWNCYKEEVKRKSLERVQMS